MATTLRGTFLENVRRRMDELGMSQHDLAESLEVSDAYVSQVLREHTTAGADGMEKFAKALNCSWLYLVTPVEPPQTSEILSDSG